jgi:hypothetical protein
MLARPKTKPNSEEYKFEDGNIASYFKPVILKVGRAEIPMVRFSATQDFKNDAVEIGLTDIPQSLAQLQELAAEVKDGLSFGLKKPEQEKLIADLLWIAKKANQEKERQARYQAEWFSIVVNIFSERGMGPGEALEKYDLAVTEQGRRFIELSEKADVIRDSWEPLTQVDRSMYIAERGFFKMKQKFGSNKISDEVRQKEKQLMELYKQKKQLIASFVKLVQVLESLKTETHTVPLNSLRF